MLFSEHFSYSVGFLEAASYSVAVTCDAATDTLDPSEDIGFVGAINVAVNRCDD